MELHYLKLFNTLASELSFSKAASLLYISQPAVSMQIKKLEEELGLKLFDRSGKSLFLTSNGRILYEYTRKIFTLVEEADIAFQKEKENLKGVVEIGASNTPGTYVLPKILGEFKELYPEVITNLHIANTYEIERMIFDERVDFAINGGDIPYGGEIYAEKLFADEVVFIASPSDRYPDGGRIESEELADARFVTHEHNSQLYKLFEDIMLELDLPGNIVMTMGGIDAIKQAVASGIGITVMPASAVKNEMKYGLLKIFKIIGKEWMYPYKLIHLSKKRLSAASKLLIDLIKSRTKSSNPGIS